MNTENEVLEFDVLIVGAGPAGLCAAIRLAQLSEEQQLNLSIAVIEKASEVGGHIVSGAVMDAQAISELLPNWLSMGAPIEALVSDDQWFHLSAKRQFNIPNWLLPASLHNTNHYLIRLSLLLRWLAEYAENLGVSVLTGFAAHELLLEQETLVGVATGDMGVDKHGNPKANYTPGYHLLAKQTLLAEGCRGHLGKQVIQQFQLQEHADPPHYGIAFKEVWQLKEQHMPAGTVWHTTGFPLSNDTEGGGYVYFLKNRQVALGLVVSLNYTNPYLDPFAEFNRWKHHQKIAGILNNAERLAYAARAVNKGGLYSMPDSVFPGGMLLGCNAGMLNPARIKGIHCAMKHAMIASEALVDHLKLAMPLNEAYSQRWQRSWLYREHHQARNFRGMISRLGTLGGGAVFAFEQKMMAAKIPWQWHDRQADHLSLKRKQELKRPNDCKLDYRKPDGKISFDRLSSIYLANLSHDEDQPCHLRLSDPSVPIQHNLANYDEPAQRYCPAGVYEILNNADGQQYLKINAQNCIHCKTCDIKDPQANIHWITPQGGSGPNYSGL